MDARYFVVQGHWSFPMDMLRFDVCHPNSKIDADKMERRPYVRRITLSSKLESAPTVDRWSSFGWTVIGVASTAAEAEAMALERIGQLGVHGS